jgi:hypothetical protein
MKALALDMLGGKSVTIGKFIVKIWSYALLKLLILMARKSNAKLSIAFSAIYDKNTVQ